MYAKAKNVPFEISNKITKYIDEYEKAKLYADEEDKDLINIENLERLVDSLLRIGHEYEYIKETIEKIEFNNLIDNRAS
jgi:hypothetical protein